MIKRYTESGNVFFALFGAVALVGIVGVSLMSFMKGPLATSVLLTKINAAENQMAVGARVAVMAASAQSNSGDCDSDGYVEPVEWRAATTEPIPTNGGLVPLTIGMNKKDPWGTEYGYCVWNHGGTASGAGCDANMLAGTASSLHTVVAIISAGADKSFTTTCRDFATADVNSDGDLSDATDLALVSKAANGDDDIIYTLTYEEASGASGGLWILKSSDPATATIDKNIEVTGDAAVSGTGNFAGGVVLPSSAGVDCLPSTAGVMAQNASGTGLEICNGSSWEAITVSSSTPSGTTTMQMGDETDNPTCSASELGMMRYNTSGTTGDREETTSTSSTSSGGTSYSTPAMVQVTAVGRLDSPPGSATRSFSTTPTAGNTVIVTISQYDNGSSTPDSFTVTDNQGGTYTLANSHYYFDGGSDLGAAYVYYRSNITTPSPSTYTVTVTGTSQFSMQIMEVSGLAASPAVDANGVGDADVNDTPLTVTGASTLSQDSEFLVSTYMSISGNSGLSISTATSGWTVGGTHNSGSGSVSYGMAFNVVSTTAQPSITWTATNTSGTRSVGVVAAFMAASTSSGPQTTVTSTVDTIRAYSNYTEICNGSAWVTVGSGMLNDLSDSADNYTGTSSSATSNSQYSMFLGLGAGASVTAGATNNTALGYMAQNALTTATDNVAMGYQAMRANTTGIYNTGFGSNAGYASNTADLIYNTVFGASAAPENDYRYNTAFGFYTLNTSVKGENSVAVGTEAMRYTNSNTSTFSTYNTAIGYQALLGGSDASLNTGQYNTAIGALSLLKNTSGHSNTAFGGAAIQENTTGESNSACGYRALYANTTGILNTACGAQASFSNDTGGYNTAIGSAALYSNVAKSANTVVGYRSLYNISSDTTSDVVGHTAVGWNAMYGGTSPVTGRQAVAIGASAYYAGPTSDHGVAVGSGAAYSSQGTVTAFGYNAGYSAANENVVAIGSEALRYAYNGPASNTNNTAIGYQAMRGSATASANTGEHNTAIGVQAMQSYTTASDNVAIGVQAANALLSGDRNVAAGYRAMYGATTGDDNIAIGHQAQYNLNGSRNIAIGVSAQYNYTGTCTDNIAIGNSSMIGNGSNCGNGNTAVGYYSLGGLTTGHSNVAIGTSAGYSGTPVTTETNNTFIGYQAGLNAAGYSNATALGNGARAYASNSITLGNTSIASIYAQVTSITAISDRRRKKDIEDTDLGLAFINTLHPVSYRFNNGDETLRYGFIAQEVEQALPDKLKPLVGKGEKGIALITKDDDKEKTYHVNYFEFIAPLIKAVQEIDKKVDMLIAKFDVFVTETKSQLVELAHVFDTEEKAGKDQSQKLDVMEKDLKALEDKLAVAK